jgi:hypothetical protein
VWQALRDELKAAGTPVEIVTVGIDAAGADAMRPFTDAAPGLTHLVDVSHRVAELFGVINVPNGVWIDESGRVVRSAELSTLPRPAAPPPSAGGTLPPEYAERMTAVMGQAMKIKAAPADYDAALRDWAANGSASRFALSEDEVVARSQPRDANVALGEANFEMACHLVTVGRADEAVEFFRAAHRLHPDNFTYRRQAWSLVPGIEGPLARFWQGPIPGSEADWPYEGDWLTDVTAMGAENYYPQWTP